MATCQGPEAAVEPERRKPRRLRAAQAAIASGLFSKKAAEQRNCLHAASASHSSSMGTQLLTHCMCVCVKAASAYAIPHMVDFLLTLAPSHTQILHMSAVCGTPEHVGH